jgi:peptide/nickel transport system ATP-binding protein
LADEPTTALDVTVQAQILQLIKELQDETGMAVLFITHDMGVVAEIADRTVVMLNGHVVETGDTADLFRHQNHPYTRALLAVVPKLGSMAGKDRPWRFPVPDQSSLVIKEPPPTIHAAPVGQKPILEVKNLTTRFDLHGGLLGRVVSRVHAVEDVSFSLQPGETLALVGESGCGKSTIGKTIMQLVRSTSGSILIDGKDISGLGGAEMRSIKRSVQMIFQDPMASLNPRKTIGDALEMPFLAHGLGTRKDAQAKAADLLGRVGLSPDMARRYPHEFSGGQRQRICIARALMLDPKLIVADESVSALDVSIKAQIVNLLMDLQENLKLAYLFISHDMAVVERVSHRVIVMYLGEIVETGSREAVFDNPQHPYTRRLIDTVPVPDPSRRRERRSIGYEEIKSAVRPVSYVPPVRRYDEVGPGHFVHAQ